MIGLPWLIYGKRTEPWYNEDTREWNEPDTTFRALDAKGIRVNKLEDAFAFAEKQDAEDFLKSQKYLKKGAVFEIRKAK